MDWHLHQIETSCHHEICENNESVHLGGPFLEICDIGGFHDQVQKQKQVLYLHPNRPTPATPHGQAAGMCEY
jgi:hypothetical protein